MEDSFKPSCNIKIIKERANLLGKIRKFFTKRKVIEVDTPLLCRYSGTAVHIDPIVVADIYNPKNPNRFLQTSPEYAMKRLLAAGSKDLYQICKAFRKEEIGKLHNPEFTILEWYRLNLDHHQLMDEIRELLIYVLDPSKKRYNICKTSYREIFFKIINIDPITTSLKTLKKLVKTNIDLSDHFKDFLTNASRQDCQELLFSTCIEPYFDKNQIWFIYDYPKEQSGLARIIKDHNGDLVAQRFEIYINGIELANGYHELTNPKLQLQRFVKDQNMRTKLSKMPLEIDLYLIQALISGLPNCSGVALGLDRLLMIKTNSNSIKDVICFPWDLA